MLATLAAAEAAANPAVRIIKPTVDPATEIAAEPSAPHGNDEVTRIAPRDGPSPQTSTLTPATRNKRSIDSPVENAAASSTPEAGEEATRIAAHANPNVRIEPVIGSAIGESVVDEEATRVAALQHRRSRLRRLLPPPGAPDIRSRAGVSARISFSIVLAKAGWAVSMRLREPIRNTRRWLPSS